METTPAARAARKGKPSLFLPLVALSVATVVLIAALIGVTPPEVSPSSV